MVDSLGIDYNNCREMLRSHIYDSALSCSGFLSGSRPLQLNVLFSIIKKNEAGGTQVLGDSPVTQASQMEA